MAVYRAVSPPMNCITFDPHGSLLLLLQRADQGDLRCMTIQFKIYNDYEITALRKLISRTGFSRVSIWRFGSVILDSLLLIHCSIPQIRVQLDCDSRSLTTRIDPRSCTRSWNALAFPQTDKVLFISRKLRITADCFSRISLPCWQACFQATVWRSTASIAYIGRLSLDNVLAVSPVWLTWMSFLCRLYSARSK